MSVWPKKRLGEVAEVVSGPAAHGDLGTGWLVGGED